MMLRYILFIVILLLACESTDSTSEKTEKRSLSESLGAGSSEGFESAEKVRNFEFPQDHGPHKNFKTEWWYLTGNLSADDGRDFGYQFTIFRVGIAPPNEFEALTSWSASEFYMGHLTLSDIQQGEFLDYERFSRGSVSLAGALTDSIWLNDWVLLNQSSESEHVFRLSAGDRDFALDIALENMKPEVLQGDRGLSQKGSKPGNASYYYSLTRMQTRGVLILGTDTLDIEGLSWMDREWSTSMLEDNQSGWDWFSIQLDNGHELMYYQLRDTLQKAGPTSSGSMVDPKGKKTPLSKSQVELDVQETWTSRESGISYPSGWTLSIPEHSIFLTIKPLLKDQELKTAVIYWEGAVDVSGNWNDLAVKGRGYVELTGYE